MAYHARVLFELGRVDEQLLETLYNEYCKIDDLALFIKRSQRIFPFGNCGIASLYLKNLLGAGKIICGSYKGNSHTFLSIKSNIIDITADQFGGPKVYIGRLTQPWSF